MEQMKMELKMLETNDSSVASVWKKKCIELFEVCGSLKEENTEVRNLCNELIVQGIHLTDAINTSASIDPIEVNNASLMKRSIDAVGRSEYAISPIKYTTDKRNPTQVSLPKLAHLKNNSLVSMERSEKKNYKELL